MSGQLSFTLCVAMLFASAAPQTSSRQAEKLSERSFKVLVLDALDGKPESSVIVRYFCEGNGWNPEDELKTAVDGTARVPFRCADGVRIEFSVNLPGNTKEECGGVDAMRFEDIQMQGSINEPNGAGGIWCPVKQRRKVKPVPGQVIVFVKKPTWWQSHIAG